MKMVLTDSILNHMAVILIPLIVLSKNLRERGRLLRIRPFSVLTVLFLEVQCSCLRLHRIHYIVAVRSTLRNPTILPIKQGEVPRVAISPLTTPDLSLPSLALATLELMWWISSLFLISTLGRLNFLFTEGTLHLLISHITTPTSPNPTGVAFIQWGAVVQAPIIRDTLRTL